MAMYEVTGNLDQIKKHQDIHFGYAWLPTANMPDRVRFQTANKEVARQLVHEFRMRGMESFRNWSE